MKLVGPSCQRASAEWSSASDMIRTRATTVLVVIFHPRHLVADPCREPGNAQSIISCGGGLKVVEPTRQCDARRPIDMGQWLLAFNEAASVIDEAVGSAHFMRTFLLNQCQKRRLGCLWPFPPFSPAGSSVASRSESPWIPAVRCAN